MVRLARSMVSPPCSTSANTAETGLTRRRSVAGRSTASTGEPERFGCTALTGPSCARRSLNDEDIVVEPFHGDGGEQAKVAHPHDIGGGALHVEAGKVQGAKI